MAAPALTRDYGAILGDSTADDHLGYTPIDQLYTSPQTEQNLAIAGSGADSQRSEWQNWGTANQIRCKWATIRVGLNDFDPGTTSAAITARYQRLASAVKRRISGKVILSTVTPCRERLVSVHGEVDGEFCYQQWLALNQAIQGGGSTPITGCDGVASSHTATLNDGLGNLLALYDHGDGIHINNAGRTIVAASEMAALTASGAI